MVELSPNTSRSAPGIDKWVVAIIAVHLAMAIPLAYHLNIWVDEASSLYASEHGFWTAFQTATVEQKQAPLYFWILSLWREIDKSIFFARLFSILCSVVSIPLFAGLAKRLFDRRGALWLTVFFGLHPFLIWASLEIRVYSLVILLTIVLLRSFFTNFWDNDRVSKLDGVYRHAAFFGLAVFSLYTNYYLGFLLAGLFAALVFSRRWREAGRFIFLMAITGAAFLPQIFELAAEFSSKSGGFRPERSVAEGTRILWHHFLTFVYPTEIFAGDEQSWMSFVRLLVMRAVVVLAGVAVIRSWKKITLSTRSFAVTILVVCMCLLASYFLIGSDYIHIRHTSVLFAPLLVFLGLLIKDIWPQSWEKAREKVIWAAVVLMLGIFTYSISMLYPTITKRGDWSRVATYISQNETPGQPIVVFKPFSALALPYYYRGANRILPDHNYFDLGIQAPAGTEASLARQNQFAISQFPPDADSLWLVMDEHCISSDACQPLENYVESHYTIELEKEFYRSKVYLLKSKNQ